MNISELLRRRDEGFQFLKGLFIQGLTNEMKRWIEGKDNKCERFEKLQLFCNLYLLRAYHKLLGYIPNDRKKIGKEDDLIICSIRFVDHNRRRLLCSAKTRLRHCLETYSGTFEKNVRVFVEQISGQKPLPQYSLKAYFVSYIGVVLLHVNYNIWMSRCSLHTLEMHCASALRLQAVPQIVQFVV